MKDKQEKNNTEPLVSVIIPAYNCAGMISRAIDSALIQKVPLEIIVIDDGSRDDLDRVMEALSEAGCRPVNADVTIIAQKPKLRPYIDQMRANLAAHMGVDVSQVSVKATTSEGMGFEGEEKGMTAHAVCLIESR